jgi:hypothetical protein
MHRSVSAVQVRGASSLPRPCASAGALIKNPKMARTGDANMRTGTVMNERFLVRCTEDLRKSLEAKAAHEGRDIAQLVREACETFLGQSAKREARA